MRPTKGIKLKDGSLIDKPEWKTKPNWLHWDQNPWKEPHFVRVQGLVTLSETNENTGGFHCVPAFHHKFEEWQEINKAKRKTGGLITVPVDDPIRNEIQKIPMRKGSLLIWDSRLPHGNFPNNNHQIRAVQYITFFPSQEEKEEEVNKRLGSFYVRLNTSENQVKLTELGEKILGSRKFSNGEKIEFQW